MTKKRRRLGPPNLPEALASDHAVLRWMERRHGMDLGPVRRIVDIIRNAKSGWIDDRQVMRVIVEWLGFDAEPVRRELRTALRGGSMRISSDSCEIVMETGHVAVFAADRDGAWRVATILAPGMANRPPGTDRGRARPEADVTVASASGVHDRSTADASGISGGNDGPHAPADAARTPAAEAPTVPPESAAPVDAGRQTVVIDVVREETGSAARERLARAIFDAMPHAHPSGRAPGWDDQPDDLREGFRRRADGIRLPKHVPFMARLSELTKAGAAGRYPGMMDRSVVACVLETATRLGACGEVWVEELPDGRFAVSSDAIRALIQPQGRDGSANGAEGMSSDRMNPEADSIEENSP